METYGNLIYKSSRSSREGTSEKTTDKVQGPKPKYRPDWKRTYTIEEIYYLYSLPILYLSHFKTQMDSPFDICGGGWYSNSESPFFLKTFAERRPIYIFEI